MDRQTLIADLRQAHAHASDAARNILVMIVALEGDMPMPRWERSHAAGNLNRAAEYVRRSYDE